MDSVLERCIKLNADGVDFHNFSFCPPLKISVSYTRKELEKDPAYPKQPYKFWVNVNGSKHYIEAVDNHPVVEILGNTELSRAFTELKISAVLLYQGEEYCIWGISQSDFDNLKDYPDNEWKEDWGWWRYASGSVIKHYPTHLFKVNNKLMIGFYEEDRLKKPYRIMD